MPSKNKYLVLEQKMSGTNHLDRFSYSYVANEASHKTVLPPYVRLNSSVLFWVYDAEPVSARIVPNEVDGQVATIPRNVNGWGTWMRGQMMFISSAPNHSHFWV